ncbi:MAG: bifunctional tetrahydrofolate synthase/dihydrofolate synthase [Gammaproteobacteria bacterium]|nr:bifunctional tetrahydrofolate synthase/dihydrofolate synthase [Gammaproteobacteria bacterium]
MRFQTLNQWLSWQETLHPSEIELGLTRVQQVFQRLQPISPSFKIITVGGTNGKGSSVAMLEAIYLAAGYKVGSYTSPHLLRYNERIHLNGEEVSDLELVQAFARVDEARTDISLTYFEFGTLAALDIFYRQQPDIVILEIGLGGRLDAVNILDADVSLVTNIALDHTDWLGDDREQVAFEKAGIYRHARPAIFNETDVPKSLLQHAEEIGAELLVAGRDYHCNSEANQWSFSGPHASYFALPEPVLVGDFQRHNACGCLMAVSSLNQDLPVAVSHIRAGLLAASNPGRMQIIIGEPVQILDVAHNPHAAAVLAETLQQQPAIGRTLAVVAMLRDKDQRGVIEQLLSQVDAWYVAGLNVPRGGHAEELYNIIHELEAQAPCEQYETVAKAYAAAYNDSGPNDRLLVFGSFYTVADVLALQG